MRSRFITSGADLRSFPATSLTEVGFLGRSNVGKSSLLNAVANAQVARTSKTPGRTQLVNFFEVSGKGYSYILADLPGYGFAEGSKEKKKAWAKLIQTYISKREGLTALLLLIDLRRGIQDEDIEIYRTLTEIHSRKVLVVATKTDKLPKAHQKPAIKKMEAALSLDPGAIIATSATSGLGIDKLRETLIGLADPASVGQTSVDSHPRG